MSRLTIFTTAAVLLALTAAPAAFAKQHHRLPPETPDGFIG